MGFGMQDLGNAIVQGPMTYSIAKPLQLGGKLNPQDMRDISALSALIGASALGGVAMGPAAGGANTGGAGVTSAAPQLGAYPGLTPGTTAGPSALSQALKIGGFLSSQGAPPLGSMGGMQSGQISSNKQNGRLIRRR